MDRRRLLPLIVPVVLLAGCAQAVDTATTVRDCAGLATDVARSGLTGVPTKAEADAAVQRLDDRIGQLGSTTVKQAASTLRDRLRDLQEAVAGADRAQAQQAVQAAREAASGAASACGLPAEQFLGTGASPQSR